MIMQIAWTLRSAGLPPLGPAGSSRLTPEERSAAAKAGWKTRLMNARKANLKRRAAKRKRQATIAAKQNSEPATKRRGKPKATSASVSDGASGNHEPQMSA